RQRQYRGAWSQRKHLDLPARTTLCGHHRRIPSSTWHALPTPSQEYSDSFLILILRSCLRRSRRLAASSARSLPAASSMASPNSAINKVLGDVVYEAKPVPCLKIGLIRLQCHHV